MRDYKNKQYLYHLTCIDNLENILEKGLLPRAEITPSVDVANPDILAGRQNYGLDKMVPFHFFANNPFDGRVQLDNQKKKFIYITVRRDYAKINKWQISPKHPLTKDGEFTLLEYTKGIEEIDWKTMNARDYSTQEGKSVCMAECLSPTSVPATAFSRIYVKSSNDEKKVREIIEKHKNISCEITVNENMFTE